MESMDASRRNGSRDGASSVGRAVDQLGSSAQQVWISTRDAVGEIREAMDVQGRVDRHPYGMMLAAVGVGYVLGGGLFSRLTGRILGGGLRIALRLAAVPFIRNEFIGMMQGAGGAGDDYETDEGVGESGGKEEESASRSRKTKQTNPTTTKGK